MYALDTFRGNAAINADCAALYPGASLSEELNTCQQVRTTAAGGQRAMLGVGIFLGLLIAHFFWK